LCLIVKTKNFVFVNAWNEWAEGNHLETRLKNGGLRYLEETKKVVQTIANE